MEQAYQHLLSIAFKHNYFKNEQFKSIQISFEGDTQRLLKNLGLILKPFPGGTHLFALNPELLNDTTLTAPLRLLLECSDPYYINYSELGDYRPSDALLYFNNLDTNSNSGSSGLQLQSEEYVGQNDTISLSSGMLTIANFEPHTNYYFVDLFGNDISDHIKQSPSGSNQFLVSDLGQGIIKIVADGQEEAQVYYNPTRIWKKPLGILELYIPQLFERYNNHGKQDYTVNFNSRQTIWKYFLVDPVYQRFDELSIVDNNREQVFNSLEKQTVHESQAFVFESKNAIPLLEYSEDTYALHEDGNPVPIIKVLPRASPEQLFYDDENNKESMYSHIYI